MKYGRNLLLGRPSCLGSVISDLPALDLPDD